MLKASDRRNNTKAAWVADRIETISREMDRAKTNHVVIHFDTHERDRPHLQALIEELKNNEYAVEIERCYNTFYPHFFLTISW